MKHKTHITLVFSRAFKVAVNNIVRNKILSIATIFVIATILFIFNIIVGVNFIAKDALKDLNKKLDITVYLKESTTQNDITKLTESIKAIDGVADVKYISKDEALNQLKKTNPDLTLSFEKYNLENPLPSSLNISTKTPEGQTNVRTALLEPKFQTYINSPPNDKETSSDKILSSVSNNLINLNNFTYQIVFWMVIIFIIGGTLIILNAIQMTVHTRNQEISIMKLVGAPFYSIRLPFMIESVLYAILAVTLSFILLYFVSNQISVGGNALLSHYNIVEFGKIFIGELACTITIAMLSTFIATDNYLHR